jgi:hypothetical protein
MSASPLSDANNKYAKKLNDSFDENPVSQSNTFSSESLKIS